MSGSSLDGLDMALCQFSLDPRDKVEFKLIDVNQIDFPADLAEGLKNSVNLKGSALMKLEADFSSFLGKVCEQYISKTETKVDLIASHGHTVFHFPEQGFTTQIGNGGVISQIAKCDVVCDFRSSDIGAGGLGAPCAPIADMYLFHDVDLFINIGGISNISHKKESEMKAFDVSPANQLLNYLAGKQGEAYDKDGSIASTGKVEQQLLDELIRTNKLVNADPRAIDNSWVTDLFIPKLVGYPIQNAMRTVVEFINLEIIRAIQFLDSSNRPKSVLITGGGAFNKFLFNDLEGKLSKINTTIVAAGEDIINYKEAMLIGLMGFLRVKRKINVLRTVTGASRNTIGGCIYAY
jgi:anhydro-N-acetylmuramic acid kinase